MLLGDEPELTPDDLAEIITAMATPDMISDIPRDLETTNKLLYIGREAVVKPNPKLRFKSSDYLIHIDESKNLQ